ncbi:unnamed protein product [Diatraea saccharalis]|uniref:Mitochondrial import inner membrane translocase subunit Tim29 n=1 Tax=Diatraea saccharalis TaxID=40085 RepID=A0A9N9R646_9NEOP|nr:unnamed protein product [Diatraea saccharalis]
MLKGVKNVSSFGKIKFPERFKGTIVEKWANYWKNLLIDYRQMLQDLRTDIQDEPVKAIKWTVGLVSIITLACNNPNEIDFKDNLKRIDNEVLLVSEQCRNRKAIEHLNFLDSCYNEEVIHYRNMGIASIMYVSALNDRCDLYKAQCPYLRPSFLSFPSRIVDIGIMGRWWNIYIKTNNYDINF